jgi:hypothetical protein
MKLNKNNKQYVGHNLTPFDFVWRQLTEQGEKTDEDKAIKVSHILGKKVESVGDLTTEELSKVSLALIKFNAI